MPPSEPSSKPPLHRRIIGWILLPFALVWGVLAGALLGLGIGIWGGLREIAEKRKSKAQK